MPISDSVRWCAVGARRPERAEPIIICKYDDGIKPTITAEINFKQTLATTYNYHCTEQCVPLNIESVLEVSRARRTSIMDGSFRIARDTIAMICWSYASLNIEINIHLRFLSIMHRIWCEWDIRQSDASICLDKISSYWHMVVNYWPQLIASEWINLFDRKRYCL